MTETTTPTTINLMPQPGTPEYENFRQYMRERFIDPRQVNFREHVRSDPGTMAFLTQGFTDPLPEITDPVRTAVTIKVELLLGGGLGDGPRDDVEYELMKQVEEALKHWPGKIAGREVIDVLLPEEPHEVTVLDQDYYREGDHFTNPIKRGEEAV